MTLDREDLAAIIDGVSRRVISEMETRGTLHADESRYPRRMSVADVAERFGVRPSTVRTNWKAWGLRMLGKGAQGRFIFDGATVARRVEQLNAG